MTGVPAVLAVDDDRTFLRVLALQLERWGWRVVPCTDGVHALAALDQPGAPRLALVDWELPDLDGPELVRRIAARPGPPVYCILLSGRIDRDDVGKALAGGYRDWLAKPVEHHELRARLGAWARRIALEEALLTAADGLQAAGRGEAAAAARAAISASPGA